MGTMATILVIDDQLAIRSFLDTLLSRKGYDVILADSGRKGLELFHRARPDAIILDLIMPEMDGLTVLQQIRSVDLKQPVIILTGTTNSKKEQQVRALGVTECVEKHFPLHRLEEVLKGLFETLDPVT
jgi:CheY-like chemotaxis protein